MRLRLADWRCNAEARLHSGAAWMKPSLSGWGCLAETEASCLGLPSKGRGFPAGTLRLKLSIPSCDSQPEAVVSYLGLLILDREFPTGVDQLKPRLPGCCYRDEAETYRPGQPS